MSGFRLRFAVLLAVLFAPWFAPEATAFPTQCTGTMYAGSMNHYGAQVPVSIVWGQHLQLQTSDYAEPDVNGHYYYIGSDFADGPPLPGDYNPSGSVYSSYQNLYFIQPQSNTTALLPGTFVPGNHYFSGPLWANPSPSCVTVVAKNDTATSLTASTDALTFGDTARLTATVSAATQPTGSVAFSFDAAGTDTLSATLKRGPASGSIAVGDAHTCSVTPSGGATCWGANGSGQLGDGTTIARSTPTAVSGLSGTVVQIAAGTAHSCALTDDGAVSCWGNDAAGQLGDGRTTSSSVPVAVAGLSAGIVALTAGANHSCALTRSGAVWCWGNGVDGQLGNGTNFSSANPVPVAGLPGAATAIAAGSKHSCALIADGSVSCWGDNGHGQLGDGTTFPHTTAMPVASLGGVTALAAGTSHTCALDGNGAVWCWGSDGHGELGDGGTTDRRSATAISGLTGMTAITAGNGHSCAIDATGAAVCWGAGTSGQLGNGATTDQAAPVSVANLPEQISAFRLQHNSGPSYTAGAAAIVAGNGRTFVVTDVGAVRGFGTNADGGLGDGTTTDRSSPAAVTDYLATRLAATATIAWPQKFPAHYPIAAHYGGDGYRATSTSPTQGMVVNSAPTTTTLTLSSSEIAFGASVDLTASVSKSMGGSVLFFDGTTLLGSAPVAGTLAKLTASGFAVGSHTLTAVYSGDPVYATSTSSDATLTVDVMGTSLSLATSSASVAWGTSITFTATVTPSDATGTIEFSDGVGRPIGTASLTSGVATFTTSTLAVGAHTIFANYGGDATHATSGSAVSQTVTKVATVLYLFPAATTAVYGQSVTLVALAVPWTATGGVSFYDGTTKLGSAVLSGGSASLPVSTLTVGTHSLTAIYSGDAGDASATSAAASAVVTRGATATGLTSSAATILPGGTVKLTALTTVTAPATGTADGAVAFSEGATALGSGTLAASVATRSLDLTTSGTHVLQAAYAGSANYLASTGSVSVTVSARIGAPTRVNATTTGVQDGGSAAVLSGGGTIVVWSSDGQDGSGRGVYGQLYAPTGVKKGTEFRVNTTVTGDQTAPRVAALDTGGFVVVWQSQGQDGSGWGVVMRRYGADGTPASPETAVNTTITNGDQAAPAVAALTSGAYVVVWKSPMPPSTRTTIRGRVYSDLGVLQGTEFRADATNTTDQSAPTIAAMTNGGFVVAWVSTDATAGTSTVRAQRFYPTAAKRGVEFALSSTSDTQTEPALAGTADGGFIAVWTKIAQGETAHSIFAQRFTATGTRTGAQTRITPPVTVDQSQPSIAAFPGGGHVVAWTRWSGSTAATHWRRYHANGLASDIEQGLTVVGGSLATQPNALVATDLAFAIVLTAGASAANTEIWLQSLGLAAAAP